MSDGLAAADGGSAVTAMDISEVLAARIASVPISTIYSDEVSSIHPVRDTIRFLKLMRRYERA